MKPPVERYVFIPHRLPLVNKVKLWYSVTDMEEKTPNKDTRATIKVCLESDCCQRGAENVFMALREGFAPEEALVMRSPRCLSGCKNGPNIAVNDNIMRSMQPITAVETVRAELRNPSCKADGIGSRSIDDLDDVLENILPMSNEKTDL